MTKKDYILIAQALAKAKPDVAGRLPLTETHQWHICVAEIAEALAADNPRFDSVIFNKACGAS